MNRIFVTGANGQLGSAIKKISETYQDLEIIYADLPEFDLTREEMTRKYINRVKPVFIINCAAFTAVDEAESQREAAFLVNAEGVKILSDLSAANDIKLFHISTDYVFDGMNFKPYTEEDIPNPQTLYGKSKLKGEEYLQGNNNSLIIRTSWLYSGMEQSFPSKILRIAKDKKEIKVIYDQTGTPTFSEDLAGVILYIIDGVIKSKIKYIPGIFHYSNEGITSWYDFAKEIIDKEGIKCKVIPVESNEFPVRTKRPHYSVLSKRKIKSIYGIEIPHWKDSLKKLKII